MSNSWRAYLPFDLRRRAVRIVQPRVQLQLPVFLLVITAGFAALFALNGFLAFGNIYDATIATAATEMEELIARQSRNFLVTTAALGVGYLIATLAACVSYIHRLMGPLVPLRRHVMALTEGDFSSRIQLRSTDSAMSELARDLNELARGLELNTEKPESD